MNNKQIALYKNLLHKKDNEIRELNSIIDCLIFRINGDFDGLNRKDQIKLWKLHTQNKWEELDDHLMNILAPDIWMGGKRNYERAMKKASKEVELENCVALKTKIVIDHDRNRNPYRRNKVDCLY